MVVRSRHENENNDDEILCSKCGRKEGSRRINILVCEDDYDDVMAELRTLLNRWRC